MAVIIDVPILSPSRIIRGDLQWIAVPPSFRARGRADTRFSIVRRFGAINGPKPYEFMAFALHFYPDFSRVDLLGETFSC